MGGLGGWENREALPPELLYGYRQTCCSPEKGSVSSEFREGKAPRRLHG